MRALPYHTIPSFLKAYEVGEVISMDISGPYKTKGLNDETYALHVVDIASKRYSNRYSVTMDQMVQCQIDEVEDFKKRFNKYPQRISSDNGSSFIAKEWINYCDKHHITTPC
jgi:hypothetical protein